ncbi:serine hydrolase [Pseudomonas sp. SBB6]|uniref:serine hydrolase domain-containing protein n=1 Tax=Pseudomonas sp. SBB6 TaxID=2962032 RepID=UPI0020B79AF6|nr:serine hydrolase domain-containing protein [Pseudomonas sp. SBB6]MCP3748663.1 beta-lactamase family protein [Pseudomonas sp. SBB6]
MLRSLRLASLFGLLLVNTGCGERAPTSLPPIGKGDYRAVIEHLRQSIPEQMQKNHVPGLSLALIDGQELVWAEGFGLADEALRMRVTPTTAFRAGSLSKLFTASATLQLVEQQRLSLDAPLSRTLPEFRVRSRFHADARSANDAITLRRLLSHQAGLPSEFLPRLRTDDPLKYLPQRASGLWLNNPPGTQMAYSNLGFALLGAAIERSSGQPFETRLQQHLLQPLAMEHSSFVGNSELQPYRARGYLQGQPSGDEEIRDLPAGGLWTTPRDVGQFVQMLFAQGRFDGRQLLSQQSVAEMFRQQNRANALDFDCPIGLAWYLGPCGDPRIGPQLQQWQHSGSTGDFAAQLSVLPEPQLAVVVMANADTAEALVSEVATQALRLMLQAQGHPLACPRDCAPSLPPLAAAVAPSPRDRQSLAGLYASPLGVIRLKDQRQQLFAELGGKRVELLRDSQGWLRAQKKLLGLWSLDLGLLEQLQLDVISVAGKEVLAVRRHGQTLPLGERIDPGPIPADWQASVGRYRLISPNEREPLLDGLTLRIDQGLLLAQGRRKGETLGEFVVQPLDDAHALLAGSALGAGNTLTRLSDGLRVLGYRFVRSPDQDAGLQL